MGRVRERRRRSARFCRQLGLSCYSYISLNNLFRRTSLARPCFRYTYVLLSSYFHILEFLYFSYIIFFLFLTWSVLYPKFVSFFSSFFPPPLRFASSGSKWRDSSEGLRIHTPSQAGLGNESCHARPERVKLQLELLTHMRDEKRYWSRQKKREMVLVLYVRNVSICTCTYVPSCQFVGWSFGFYSFFHSGEDN